MIRISKLADYAILLLSTFARETCSIRNAPELAADTRLPLPTVSKLLKTLSRAGLLESHRGVKGGYSLPHRPTEVSVAEIITAVDGPISLTDCSAEPSDEAQACSMEPVCPVKSNWRRINQAVRDALEHVSLADMARSDAEHPGLEPNVPPKLSVLAQRRLAVEAAATDATPSFRGTDAAPTRDTRMPAEEVEP